MAKRSNLIVSIGLAVFTVGAGATYLVARDSGGTARAADKPQAAVLYADKGIPAGTSGDTAVAQGLVKSKQVDADTKPPTALTDSSELAGRTAQGNIPEGQILTADAFALTQTRIGTVKIPPGHTALALQMASAPGVAGFAGAGDKIDVFAVVKTGTPTTHLVMQNIDVLGINGGALAPNPGTPSGASLVFLLSVTQTQAEHLVYLASFEQLYFSLVAKDQAPVPNTPGVGPADILKAA